MGSARVQGVLWGAAADDWSQFAEPNMAPVYETVLDAVGVTRGTKLLDAGCGAGLALQLAQKRGAVVSGLDASAPLLAVAGQRVPEADLREGDLEELPYTDDAFDVVTAFNSIQFAADPVGALRELARVARPGARVAVVTWAAAERCESRACFAAIGALLPPPPPGTAGPFALSEPGRLEALLSAAGLTPEQAGEVPVPFIAADLDAAVRAQLSAGPARVAIERAGVDAVVDALHDAMVPFRQPDGSYRQDNAFRYLVATA